VVVAKRLRDSMRNGDFRDDQGDRIDVRASHGIATLPHDAQTPHTSSAGGRNDVCSEKQYAGHIGVRRADCGELE